MSGVANQPRQPVILKPVLSRIAGVTEQDLLDRGIELIAISFVDNAGLTRAKSITAAKAEAAATRGVGSPHAFSIFQGDDGMSTATGFEAVGDTRLVPHLGRLPGGLDGWGPAPRDPCD